jgi:hypothetical protein
MPFHFQSAQAWLRLAPAKQQPLRFEDENGNSSS